MYSIAALPVAWSGIIHLAFWQCPYQPPFTSISGCNMEHFKPWYGPYHVLKWCLLHDVPKVARHKPLIYNILQALLIFHVFASKEESSRKCALIFWGRTENPDEKITEWWKSVSAPYCFHFSRKKRHCSGIETAVFYFLMKPVSAESHTGPVVISQCVFTAQKSNYMYFISITCV